MTVSRQLAEATQRPAVMGVVQELAECGVVMAERRVSWQPVVGLGRPHAGRQRETDRALKAGRELLFDVFSQCYENGATIVTSNLPFQQWASVFASERLTGALLDRITHDVHILEMSGEGYQLGQSRFRRRRPSEQPPIDRVPHSPFPRAGPRVDYADKLPPSPWYIYGRRAGT